MSQSYLEICKNVLLAPVRFFRTMSITEGIRGALYFAVTVYYIKSIIYFFVSYHRGYFFHPAIKVSPVFTTYSALFLLITPFLFLLVLYSQSIFINRIGTFFGGIGNLEGGFKILAFALFISLFFFIPIVGFVARVWVTIVLIIGVKEVFNTDWISSVLTLFFSYVFTMGLYIIVFGFPAMMSKMFMFRF